MICSPTSSESMNFHHCFHLSPIWEWKPHCKGLCGFLKYLSNYGFLPFLLHHIRGGNHFSQDCTQNYSKHLFPQMLKKCLFGGEGGDETQKLPWNKPITEGAQWPTETASRKHRLRLSPLVGGIVLGKQMQKTKTLYLPLMPGNIFMFLMYFIVLFHNHLSLLHTLPHPPISSPLQSPHCCSRPWALFLFNASIPTNLWPQH